MRTFHMIVHVVNKINITFVKQAKDFFKYSWIQTNVGLIIVKIFQWLSGWMNHYWYKTKQQRIKKQSS